MKKVTQEKFKIKQIFIEEEIASRLLVTCGQIPDMDSLQMRNDDKGDDGKNIK